MDLEELLNRNIVKRDLEILCKVAQTHEQRIYTGIENEIKKKYSLSQDQFSELYTEYVRRYRK